MAKAEIRLGECGKVGGQSHTEYKVTLGSSVTCGFAPKNIMVTVMYNNKLLVDVYEYNADPTKHTAYYDGTGYEQPIGSGSSAGVIQDVTSSGFTVRSAIQGTINAYILATD